MLDHELVIGILNAGLHVGGTWTAVSLIAAAFWTMWRSPGRAQRIALEDAR